MTAILVQFIWPLALEIMIMKGIQFVVDKRNRKVGVQLDIETYQKNEEILENYALIQLMMENEGEEKLNIKEAKAYYKGHP